MQILLFTVFVTAVVFFLLGLGYGLSSLEEERSSTQRYRMPHKMRRRRKVKRQRVRCRSER